LILINSSVYKAQSIELIPRNVELISRNVDRTILPIRFSSNDNKIKKTDYSLYSSFFLNVMQ